MLNTEPIQPYTSRFDQTEPLYEQVNSMDSASLNMSHSSSALSSSALSGIYETSSDQQQQQLNQLSQQQSQQNAQQPNPHHQIHYQPQQIENIKQEPHYVDLQQMYVPANGQQQQLSQQQQLNLSNQLAMAGGHSIAQSAAMHQLTNTSHMPSATNLTNSSSEYKISAAPVNTSSATGNSSTGNGSTANAERIRRPMNACE